MRGREALFIISVAARMVGMHAQTLRKYEREGFLEPTRTDGRLRLYSPEDVRRLRQIKRLVDERGVNLAGIQLALSLAEQLRMLSEEVDAIHDVQSIRSLIHARIEQMLLELEAEE